MFPIVDIANAPVFQVMRDEANDIKSWCITAFKEKQYSCGAPRNVETCERFQILKRSASYK
jgi:hypothetical protein